jgi:hypothetical protein
MSSSYPSQSVAGRRAQALSVVTPMLFGTLALAASGAALAAGPCAGPGAPAPTSPIICIAAVAIPGNPIFSFDISWVNPGRAEYYLADRSNAGVDVIQTSTARFQRTIGGFVGAVVNPMTNTVVTARSGPNGVVSHGRWLYAGDGNSTLKVIDLQATGSVADPVIKQSIATGGTTRVDEMALTEPDGKLLLAANNAEDPPFATMFAANGDNFTSATTIIAKINVDATIIPGGLGLSMEQPTWDPGTKRFYVAIPQINYPQGCTPFSATTTNPCYGGLLVIDPNGVRGPTTTYGPFDSTVNAGVLALRECGPNGAVIGPNENLLLGCTPANQASDSGTLVINALTRNSSNILGITGSDEVWFNPGDNHYYSGSSANRRDIYGGPALGIFDAQSNILTGTIPQGSGSHSVAADSLRNFIFVPQTAPLNPNLPGGNSGETTGVSAQLCGTSMGCVVVYFDQNPVGDPPSN